ncbi:MAG: DUF3801 domain-containing protein [Ancrocorticia sp.]
MSVIGGEQLSEQIIISTTKAATEITAALTRGSEAMIKQVAKIAGAALHKVDRRKEGKMTIKNLQRVSGGDLHSQSISPELYHTLIKDLKKRGVDFSIEKGKDSLTYVHFKGADVDTVRHALKQVEAKLGLTPPKTTNHEPGQPSQGSPDQKNPTKAAPQDAPPKQTPAYYRNVALTGKPQTRKELTQTIQQRARTIKKTQTRTPKRTRAHGAR